MITALTPIRNGDEITAPNGTTSRVAVVRGKQLMIEDPDGSRFVVNRERLFHWAHTRRDGEQQASTSFAAAVEAVPSQQRWQVARGLGMTIGQLRKRISRGWSPEEPMAQAQVAAVLGRDVTELFPDHRGGAPDPESWGPWGGGLAPIDGRSGPQSTAARDSYGSPERRRRA
jgi:hypothetical protein